MHLDLRQENVGQSKMTLVFHKSSQTSIPTQSHRALLAAQLLDEETRPSRRALVAAQLIADEATYDPLLLRNIDAGQYSKELQLFTKRDTYFPG